MAEIPFQLILPPIYNAIIWELTGQPPDLWRFLNYTGIMIVVTFTGQSD